LILWPSASGASNSIAGNYNATEAKGAKSTRDHFVEARRRPSSTCLSASTPRRYGYLRFAGAGRPEQMDHLMTLNEIELGQR
jgi:hypothetical protein